MMKDAHCHLFTSASGSGWDSGHHSLPAIEDCLQNSQDARVSQMFCRTRAQESQGIYTRGHCWLTAACPSRTLMPFHPQVRLPHMWRQAMS